MATVLVTGGAGYVGSHTVVELLNQNYKVVVVDNLVNAIKVNEKPESLRRVEALTGKKVAFYEVSLLDKETLRSVFKKHSIQCVLHFAALKAVGESCAIPLDYYINNVGGSMALVEVMKEHNVKKMVFSSSATVYGNPCKLPIDEDHPVGQCTNPYGSTKHFIEVILRDVCEADKEWSIMVLRYFNPVGAHPSSELGEDPRGVPNNLLPYIAQVAVGRLEELKVFGHDYATPDGTGVRDYLHVMDLATGHVAALRRILEASYHGWRAFNLGTGTGYSVLQVVEAFGKACGKKIPFQLVDRRPGDVPESYADAGRAQRELGWVAERSLDDMCLDTWRWQSKYPNGFSTSEQKA